jgi:hypothetical protein
MGAVHFLEHEFSLQDAYAKNVHHDLELFETGGELFLRIWIGGLGKNSPVVCRLTQSQASNLAEGAEALARRLRM